jgi:CheY-like chemotaxis protein
LSTDEASAGESRKRKKVLVAEDEKELADLYTIWLSEEYEVVTAHDGEEAVEKYDEDVDVVLLDRRMPKMSGDEALEEIRDGPGDCMAAMVTAVEPKKDILSMEFEEYLRKPTSKDELTELTENLISLSESDEDSRAFELEAKSSALNLNELADAVGQKEPDRKDLLEGLAETVWSVASPSLVAVWEYDGSSLSLHSCASDGIDDPEEVSVGLEGVARFAYSGRPEEKDSEGDLPEKERMRKRRWVMPPQQEFGTDELPEGIPAEYCVSNRIGEYGVVLSLFGSERSVDEQQKASMKSVTAMITSSLDSRRYKRRAEEKKRLSEEYRQKTSALEEANRTVRNTTKSLLGAKTRSETEKEACRGLVGSMGIEFVWMGDYVESGNSMETKHATDDDYMERMGENEEMRLAKECAKQRETHVVEGIGEGSPGQWEERAERNGFGSVVRVPMMTCFFFHGVLNAFVGDDEVNGSLRSAVEDVARVTGHVINSHETRASLVSDSATELTFRVGDGSFPPVRFASEAKAEVSLGGTSPTEQEGQVAYIDVTPTEEGEQVRDNTKAAAEALASVDSLDGRKPSRSGFPVTPCSYRRRSNTEANSPN